MTFFKKRGAVPQKEQPQELKTIESEPLPEAPANLTVLPDAEREKPSHMKKNPYKTWGIAVCPKERVQNSEDWYDCHGDLYKMGVAYFRASREVIDELVKEGEISEGDLRTWGILSLDPEEEHRLAEWDQYKILQIGGRKGTASYLKELVPRIQEKAAKIYEELKKENQEKGKEKARME